MIKTNPNNEFCNHVILIVGPTAVGKTYLSLKLAYQNGGEIVSADSRQIYKFMNIGTAKPTLEERASIPHHFIDIKYPDEYYSAGRYGKEARLEIKEIQKKGKLPIVVGGSGLYIKALVDGFFDAEVADAQIKKKLNEQLKLNGLARLYEQLLRVDPTLASKISPNDTQRILRGLEVWEITGTPLSQLQQETRKQADFNPVIYGLTMERQQLYRIIEERVDRMIQQGLIEEVQELIKQGYSDNLNSLQTVGYKEVFDYLKNKYTYFQMIDMIKQKSRNYAKRQMTWFRKEQRITWFAVEDKSDFKKISRQIETPCINK